jgi:methionine synthase I (cobalamin-dependent)
MILDAFAALAPRLRAGRPLLLGGDVGASMRARGVIFSGPGALGRLVREHGDAVDSHYAVEVEAGVDVLMTLTSDTTPRSLAQVGMAYRAAAITAMAVDRAIDAADRVERPIAIAGVLGGSAIAPLDMAGLVEEHGVHAARLSAAGSSLILARGMASRSELMAAVVAAANTDLPTWAVVEADADGSVLGGEPPGPVVRMLESAGATTVLFEASTTSAAREALEGAMSGTAHLPLGVLLDAGPGCIEGYPEGAAPPDAWAEAMLELLSLNPRAIGGGRGCTQAHTAALARTLRHMIPSMAPPPHHEREGAGSF